MGGGPLTYVVNAKLGTAGGTFGPKLLLNGGVKDRLAADVRRLGFEPVRDRLLELLADPDRYAAAHLGLRSLYWKGGGSSLRGEAGWFTSRNLGQQDPVPAVWIGLEYDSSNNIPGPFRPHRRELSMERVRRYWREYFAGERTDFTVFHSREELDEMWADWIADGLMDQKPFRPADEPLPVIDKRKWDAWAAQWDDPAED